MLDSATEYLSHTFKNQNELLILEILHIVGMKCINFSTLPIIFLAKIKTRERHLIYYYFFLFFIFFLKKGRKKERWFLVHVCPCSCMSCVPNSAKDK
jgi:hypothetical protein